jgi:hypothetical protein
LLILNYSYRGDRSQDRSDIAELARETGMAVLRDGSCDLTLWDGLMFHLQRPRKVPCNIPIAGQTFSGPQRGVNS